MHTDQTVEHLNKDLAGGMHDRGIPADLYITPELDRRPRTKANYLQEKRALEDLASRMLDHPEEVLPRFVDLALQMTGGASAGLSLYEENPAPGVFRWRYLRALLSLSRMRLHHGISVPAV